MDETINRSCEDSFWAFQLEWHKEVPKFPECEIYILPGLLSAYCVLVCIPYIIKLSLKNSGCRRSFTPLLLSEFVILSVILLNNALQFGILCSVTNYQFEYPPYTSLSLIFVSIVYCLLLNTERIRDAPNSGVSFYLMLLSTLAASIRCWNHGVDWLQPSQAYGHTNISSNFQPIFNISEDVSEELPIKHIVQSTDAINLSGSVLLLFMACFSERMLRYERKYRCRQHESRISFCKKLVNQVHSTSAKESENKICSDKEDGLVAPRNEIEEPQIPSPEKHASYLSRMVYAWFTRLIIKGYRKPLELKDLWQLDEQHRAATISNKFFSNVDRYVIPKKMVNMYMEKRRMSLISVNADGTNENCDESMVGRRRSAQSVLGVGRLVDGHRTYKSGFVDDDQLEIGKIRRASEGIRLKSNEANSEHISGQCQAPDHFTEDKSKTPTTLDHKSSMSIPEGIPYEDKILHSDEKLADEKPSQINSANVVGTQRTGILGPQQRSVARRSVRIKVGNNHAFLPGQSESRSDSVLTQPTEDQVSRMIESMDKQPKSASCRGVKSPESETVAKHSKLSDAPDVEIHGSKFDPSGFGWNCCTRCKYLSYCSCVKGPHRLGLLHALTKTFWRPLLWSAILKLMHDILVFVNPRLLKLLLRFLQEGFDEPVWHGYLYAILMLVTACFQSLLLQRYFRLVNILGMHVRTAVTCAVYRKSLRLSNRARRESTTGQIMNLISSDAQHFVQLMPFINIIWSGPFQIIVAIVFLWYELGPSVLAGIAVLLLLLPLNAIVARFSKSFQEKKFVMADSRIKMISEILNGIRVIKLYAWEPSFIKEVTRLRNNEIHYLRRFTYCQSISFLWACAPFLVALSSFGVYIMVSEENILDAQKAFVSLSLFNILRFPLFMFPMVINNLVQTFVSLRRLNTFLKHTELNPNSFSREDTPGVAAVIERGVFGWSPEDEPVLKNISIQFPEGQLTSIMGTVGSGKSSLLHALLGDMELFNGRVNVKGTVAYVPQQPWIFNATLRDNILFSHPYDRTRYERVIAACGLKPDLLMLPKGDMTEIGDKGINLSGGQKQRVSLARACYADADIYLLDDPLSAVDAHVGLHLLNHVLSRTSGLLSSKTCILTTHSSKALPFSDRVALLVDGQLSELGTYRQLLHSRTSRLSTFLADTVLSDRNRGSQGPETTVDCESHGTDFVGTDNENNDAVNEHFRQSFRLETSIKDPSINTNDLQSSHQGIVQQKRSHSVRSNASSIHRSSQQPDVTHRHRTLSASSDMLPNDEAPSLFDSLLSLNLEQTNENAKEEVEPQNTAEIQDQFIQSEKANTGRVKWRVFKIYLQNLGLLYCLGVLILFPLTNVAQFGTNLWLADWSKDAKLQSNITEAIRNQPEILRNLSAYPDLRDGLNELHHQRDYRLGVYAAIGFVQVSTSLASILVFAFGHLGCVQKLHGLLLNGIFHAPAAFFDTVPAGRIINRFSQDVATIDGPLLTSMRSALMCFIQCFLTLCMACAVNPWSVIPIFCLTVLYLLLQTVYVANSRQLKRIESVSRSPIFSHFSETLSGVECIRAYGLTDQYAGIISSRLDINNAATYTNILAQRWLAILLESVGNMVILFVALFAVSARGQLSAGFSGLVISYALNLNQLLNWFVRMTAELENDIVCVERLHEYSQIDQEAQWEVPENKPAENWPEGSVEFINYGTRYRPQLDLVLSSISVSVNRGERIGIVGRTGSGKSSLVMGLFRMLEAAEGQIKIDGIDIATLGLHDLRSRLTLIPQDPVLFSGTLRFNLDPFDKHSDEELWTILELAHLKNFVKEASNGLGLDMVISEGGSNISMGQRQLVCLARALLRRTPILVLDEATAAVDPITDNLIQETIRTEFSQCTVLTIAHRLNTILDYDRIILLHDGRIAEMGNPRDLLRKPDCKFYSLAKDAHLVE